ncbi:hypothetical protein H5410_035506 [Solanum commersonii]|uniref:Uncharacterized protein n=1 Tax=Solanum commersonii TaxID=4109 RepID=A0A9J5Y2U6_SOLCO|nr:hypothetical protein H5410_035506 [Solanum commersonii]
MGKRNNPRDFLITWSLLLLKMTFGLTSREVNKTLCIEKERNALLEFKRGLNDDFGCLSTWVIKKNVANGRVLNVTKEQVMLLFLISIVSPCLLELEYLNFLDLSVNGFENSEIPRFIGSLKRLEILDLENNKLTIKDRVWLSHLSSLEFLGLGGNDFQASNWFREITKVPSLKELDLSVCGLSKFIPSPADLANSSLISLSLFNFSTSLTSIDLSHNQLIRQIDDRFGSLMYLEHLNLAINFEVKGRVPSSFRSLMYLEHLNPDMSNTQTYQWLPELFLRLSSSRKSLAVLGLNDNSLFG